MHENENFYDLQAIKFAFVDRSSSNKLESWKSVTFYTARLLLYFCPRKLGLKAYKTTSLSARNTLFKYAIFTALLCEHAYDVKLLNSLKSLNFLNSRLQQAITVKCYLPNN